MTLPTILVEKSRGLGGGMQESLERVGNRGGIPGRRKNRCKCDKIWESIACWELCAFPQRVGRKMGASEEW